MTMAEDLDAYSNNITTTIMETAVEIAGRDKPLRQEKLSKVTRQLREKRRQMKRKGTDGQHIEYTDICKAIRQRMKEEINSYNEEEQLKALVNNIGLKSTKWVQCLGRNNIVALKEKDGRLIEDRDRMIKRCEEFYTELYSTRRAQDQPSIDGHYMETGPLPPILPSEVRNAIKRQKRDKAPGEDNRELTKRRRRRQRRRYKTIGLVSKNNGSARSARAFYILVHFFGVIS